jgi:hypothetical protein
MTEPLHIVVGRRDSDHVPIEVQGRMHPGADDYWDGNWLTTPLAVRAGAFSGVVGADLRTDEFRRFREELQTIYSSLKGTATLASLDGWIALTAECQPNGGLVVSGVVNDQPGIGNELEFSLPGLDQSDLPPLIDALCACEAAFPSSAHPANRCRSSLSVDVTDVRGDTR